MKKTQNIEQVQETKTEGQNPSWSEATTAKVMELVKQGKSPEEAMLEVLKGEESRVKVSKASSPRIADRVAYIQGLNSIQEVRKARKTAYAKKSKSKDKPEACDRYEKEIEAATAKLNELLAEVNSAECPWKKALELGETVDGALQYFVQDLEAETEKAWDSISGHTKAEIKVFCQGAQVTDSLIPDELKETFNTRVEHKDQRLISLVQKAQSLEDLKSGARTWAPKAEAETK